MQNYPFIKCLCPRKIHNPYLHEDMLVPCGNCEACSLKKSASNTLKVQIEASCRLYSRFVTLTYSNEWIPRMTIVDSDLYDDDRYLHPYKLVDSDYGNVISSWDDIDSYNMVCRKQESYDVAFLRKYDLQCFLKRIRKYFDVYAKKNNVPIGKIRYYAIGEYGPKHFRPHYHIIFWADDDEIASNLGQAVSACWKFGRVSTEIPKSDICSYVAKYVNGSMPLPKILKLNETRPFAVHSLHLGKEFFACECEKVYESPYREFIIRGFFKSNTYTEVSMWRSLKTYFFPRCKKFTLLNPLELHDAYKTFKTFADRFGYDWKECKISELTETLVYHLEKEFEIYSSYYHDFQFNRLFNLCEFNPFDFGFDDGRIRIYRNIYSVLRLSRHFLLIVCKGDESLFAPMIAKVIQFWKDDELYIMNQAYQTFSEVEFENEEEYKLRFDVADGAFVDIAEILNTKKFREFKQDRIWNYGNSMKHKKQNDANRILENK